MAYSFMLHFASDNGLVTEVLPDAAGSTPRHDLIETP